MEILFVSHKYPPSVGGMEKQSFELINGMYKYAKVHKLVFSGKGGRLGFFWGLQKNILAICKANPGISVIHFNDATIAVASFWHKGYSHLKHVVTVHGLDVVFPNRTYQQRIFPKFNSFDLIIAVSHATAQECIKRGIDAHKVKVVANGVDPHFILPDANNTPLYANYQPYLVTIGRAVERKGFSWFVQNVLPKLTNCHLLIIGPFSPQKTFSEKLLSILPQKLRKQLELFTGFPTDQDKLRTLLKTQPNVTHLGKLPQQILANTLQQATAFIMPNISVEGDMEGFGLVCLEASLSGVMVLAADCGGIPDAIHNHKNGLLLPSGNAEAWINAIEHLLLNTNEHQQLAEAGRNYTLQNFSWDKMVQEYYEHIAQNTSPRITANPMLAAVLYFFIVLLAI